MTPCPAGRAALSVIGTTAALGAATLAYSLIEARRPVLRRIDVPVLAADEEPLTVLHLADLHLTGHTEARVAWVRRLAQLQPDVVVNTGDNLSLASGLEPLRRALEPLTGLPGAFVMGDHDYRSTVFRLPTRYLHRDPRKASSRVRDEDIEALPWEEVRDLQAAGGWVDLTNRRGSLTVRGRVAPGQQAAVYGGVQGFHAAIEHFGKARDFGHFGHGQARVFEQLGGAAGGQQAKAQRGQRCGEFGNAGFVGYGNQGVSCSGVHGSGVG